MQVLAQPGRRRARVDAVGAAFPRPLADPERSPLEVLLAEDFPGSDELRAQARTVRVNGFWEDRPSVVLLEVMDPGAPRANVVHVVPVEAKVRDADPPQELLLFVKDGLLDSIELVDYSGNDAVGLPDIGTVEPPAANSAGTSGPAPRGREPRLSE